MNRLMVLVILGLMIAGSFGGEDRKSLAPKPLLELEAPKKRSMISAAFTPDDRVLLTGGGDCFGPGDLRQWNLSTGVCQALFTNHKLEIWSVALSADGKYAATGGGFGEVKLWDAASGKVLADLNAGCEYSDSVAFSPDGKFLASGGLDAARVWNVQTQLLCH